MADEAAIEALEHIGEPLVLYLAELGYLMQQQNPDFRGGILKLTAQKRLQRLRDALQVPQSGARRA